MDKQTGGQTNMQSEKEHFWFTKIAWDKNVYSDDGNPDRKRYIQSVDLSHMGQNMDQWSTSAKFVENFFSR